VPEQNTPELFADRHIGVQRLHGVLENHADALRPNPVELPLGRADDLFTVEANAAVDCRIGRQQTHDCQCRLRLSRARFADQTDRLARIDTER
jgi:hypothetical protein